MSKLYKKMFIGIVFLIFVVILCGCQESPINNTVITKNDGSFDVDVIVSNNESEETSKIETFRYEDSFYSMDGSVIYKFDLNDCFDLSKSPVVQVSPHNITSEDAKKIAESFFGDATWYLAQPEEQLTKAEIESKISLWSKYLNADELRSLYGDSLTNSEINEWQNMIENVIKNYSESLPTAPETINKFICDWTFHPASYYLYTEAELSSMKKNGVENQEIVATTEIGEIPYKIMISNRDEDDYKIHNISIFIQPIGTATNLISSAIKYSLCKSESPSKAQLERVQQKALSILNSTGLGTWEINSCYSKELEIGREPAYKICINAVPTFNGVKAVPQQQLENLKSTEVYASNYYYTDANFEFSPDGTLLSCSIISPVDVTQVINNNVQTLSFEKILEIAKNNFMLRDYYEYAQNVLFDENMKFNCNVTITNAEYGLTRVKAPNTNNSYYYVPAVTFRGNYQAFENSSGDLWFDSFEWWGEPQTLLVLNAIDGTVINVTNGY